LNFFKLIKDKMMIYSYNIDKGKSEPVSLENLCLFCNSYDGCCIKKCIGVSSLYHCNSPKPNGEEIKTERVLDLNSGKRVLKIISGEINLTVAEELLYVAPAQV